jgi:hypothetical protein
MIFFLFPFLDLKKHVCPVIRLSLLHEIGSRSCLSFLLLAVFFNAGTCSRGSTAAVEFSRVLLTGKVHVIKQASVCKPQNRISVASEETASTLEHFWQIAD